MRRVTRILLLGVVVLAAGAPSPASAEHGGTRVTSAYDCQDGRVPERCVSVGDDARHYIYIDGSVPPALADSFRRAMRHAYGSTDLRMIEQSAINRRTDVIVLAGDYGLNGAAGWVVCPADAPRGRNEHGDRWCRHQELYFNLNQRYAAFFADADSRTHLSCHEIGHSIGLRHWGNPPRSEGPTARTCMNADTPDGPTRLHQLDRDHIDAYYAQPAPPPKLCASEF